MRTTKASQNRSGAVGSAAPKVSMERPHVLHARPLRSMPQHLADGWPTFFKLHPGKERTLGVSRPLALDFLARASAGQTCLSLTSRAVRRSDKNAVEERRSRWESYGGSSCLDARTRVAPLPLWLLAVVGDWQPVAATTSRIKRWRRRKPRSENRRRFAEAGHGRRDSSQRDIRCAQDNTKSTLDGIRQNTSDARDRLREVRSQDSQARSTLVKLQGKVSGVRSQIARNTFAGKGTSSSAPTWCRAALSFIRPARRRSKPARRARSKARKQ
jgi:hypothetical protein